jgi:hypothetical protein
MNKIFLFFALFLGLNSYGQTVLYEKDSLRVSTVKESDEYKDARLKCNVLKNKKGTQDMLATFDVKNYTLKASSNNNLTGMCANSKDGQHIHFIVDNKPYTALYENYNKWTEASGSHLMLAFLSRSHHQSLKHKSAYQLKAFHVGKPTKVYDLTAPYLFFSRPKGTYVDKDAEKIMIDFYLVNCTLKKGGYSVKVELDQTHTFYIEEWTPILLEGLAMGEHTLKLTLVNSKDQAVKNEFNGVERKFILMKNPK